MNGLDAQDAGSQFVGVPYQDPDGETRDAFDPDHAACPCADGLLVAPLLALSLAGSSRAQGLYEKDYPTCLAMCQVNNELCIKRITDPKSWQPRECKNSNDICLHVCRQRYNK
jgi:hypothetical protein